MKQIVVGILSLLFFAACSSDQSLKPYYYQINDYLNPKIFVYDQIGNPDGRQYWRVFTDPMRQELTTEVYNAKFILTEISRESFNDSGSKFIVYSSFSNGQETKAKITREKVFMWDSNAEYEYELDLPYPDFPTVFNKQRNFERFTELEVMGHHEEGIEMRGEYHFTNTTSGDEYTYWQYSYYTKEHAFVGWERHYSDEEFAQKLWLVDVLTDEEWELVKPN